MLPDLNSDQKQTEEVSKSVSHNDESSKPLKSPEPGKNKTGNESKPDLTLNIPKNRLGDDDTDIEDADSGQFSFSESNKINMEAENVTNSSKQPQGKPLDSIKTNETGQSYQTMNSNSQFNSQNPIFLSATNDSSRTDPNASFFKENPIILVTKKEKERGFFGSIFRYVKCTVLVLLLFVFSSLFINVYQSFLGNCEGLEEEIDRLEALNDELEVSVSGLELQNDAIREEVNTFNESNTQLSRSIQNLSTINTEYTERISSLTDLSTQLSSVLEDPTLTFDNFRDTVLTTTTELETENERVLITTNNLKTHLENISEALTSLREKRSNLSVSYESLVTSTNSDFLSQRISSVEVFAAFYSLSDGFNTISVDEFDEVIKRAVEVLLNNSDAAQQFSIDEAITQEAMFEIINSIALQSLEEDLNLFVENIVETE